MKRYARVCEALRYEPRHFEMTVLVEPVWGRPDSNGGFNLLMERAPTREVSQSGGRTLHATAPSVRLEIPRAVKSTLASAAVVFVHAVALKGPQRNTCTF